MKKREPWIETRLKDWAVWLQLNARWIGWGSGVDKVGLLAEAGWGRSRNPGCYSNPTLAEVMAATHDGQSKHWRLDTLVRALRTTERRVVVARYCGKPVTIERDGVVRTVWSGGPLPFTAIADLLRLAQSSCYEALDRAKLRLMYQLEMDDSIRFGHFSPDGGKTRQRSDIDEAA